MRVTNSMMISNMMISMNRSLQSMSKYEEQMATGKKIQRTSEDPIIAARALKLRTNVSEIEQFQRNVDDGLNWMQVTEGAMQNIGNTLQRVRELTVQASNGTTTTEDRQKIESEIKQLKDLIVGEMNTSYAGRYVFSGFQTDQKLLNTDGTYAITVKENDVIYYEVSVGNQLDINTNGQQLLEFDYNGVPANAEAVAGNKPAMISMLDNLIQDLENEGDTSKISNYLSDIDKAMGQLLETRADLGSRYNRLEVTKNRLQDDNINFTKLMSENEDADLAEVLMNLKTQENVYKASMAAGARVIQPTLIDFLR